MNRLDGFNTSWDEFIQSENHIPNFDILAKYNLPENITREEFISVDIYMTLYSCYYENAFKMECYTVGENDLFMDIFENYFNNFLVTKESAIKFLKSLKKLYRQTFPNGIEVIESLLNAKFNTTFHIIRNDN